MLAQMSATKTSRLGDAEDIGLMGTFPDNHRIGRHVRRPRGIPDSYAGDDRLDRMRSASPTRRRLPVDRPRLEPGTVIENQQQAWPPWLRPVWSAAHCPLRPAEFVGGQTLMGTVAEIIGTGPEAGADQSLGQRPVRPVQLAGRLAENHGLLVGSRGSSDDPLYSPVCPQL